MPRKKNEKLVSEVVVRKVFAKEEVGKPADVDVILSTVVEKNGGKEWNKFYTGKRGTVYLACSVGEQGISACDIYESELEACQRFHQLIKEYSSK